MPKISVIIPVYNASAHLRECLDSVLAQTLRDIEVICIDDGSSDGSLELLREYGDKDSRITVLSQPNAGAGAARNFGIDHARGTFFSFLDADDFFEPKMLEVVSDRCETANADIAVFRARYYDGDTGIRVPVDGMVRKEMVPRGVPFSVHDYPEYILTFTPAAPWNKLYRAAFVIENGLRFQKLRRANDLYFTKLAMVKARRIICIDEAFVNYRVGHTTGLQATNHETPLEFYQALAALKKELLNTGLFAEVERSFVNTALLNCIYNLRSLRTPEAFRTLYERLRNEYFSALGIEGKTADYFYYKNHYLQYVKIMSSSPDAYLLEEIEDMRTRLEHVRGKIQSVSKSVEVNRRKADRIRRSRSYRLGEAIGSVLSRTRRPFSAGGR